MGSVSAAVVSTRGARRWAAGHPWIYRSDVIEHPDAPGIVPVRDARGKFLGQALCSPRSEIRLRLLTRDEAPIDGAWWRTRFRACRDRRGGIDATAWREVHAEGDGLPALIVDRYDRWLVIQLLSAALETRRGEILDALLEIHQPEGILCRHDVPTRRLEGLDETIELVHGDVPDQVEVREGSIRWLAAPRTGQKTGAFLDQRENRLAAGALVPEGGTALDCFSYHGSFALHLAGRAREVVALDASAEALARGREHAELNGFTNIAFEAADAFDTLPAWHRAGRQFNVVVVDPPAFAKAKGHLPAAIRGYREINRRAMQLLAPGGWLVTASCSFHLRRPDFLEMLTAAAADTGRRLTLAAILGQPVDHPELLTVPETGYLKGAILRAD
ncbi:MAG: class I SAM-dependent rRNA methyltransferase [Gemmatimonadetes bacterium]|nr:class I SAM-dependent rRNA methyltransferase [Gemmatimonadota bacterium]